MTSRRLLPLVSPRWQVLAAIVLALLLSCTRGQHFASIHALPSASWAMFFLAGALIRPRLFFVLLFALAVGLDFGSYAMGTISDWCLSPAYWVLLPAYGTLWLFGRIYAHLHRSAWSDVPRLAAILVLAAFCTFLISDGGYYLLSGHYQPSWSGFLPRIPHYYPHWLGVMAGYVGVALGVLETVRWLLQHRRHHAPPVRA